MSDRPFDPSVAVIPCPSCAGPVVGPPGGGASACPACGAPCELPARPRPAGGEVPGRQDPSLRAQDGKPLLPPPTIAFLFESGDSLPDHRRDEATAAWQSARRRVETGDVGAGEELVFLGRELSSKWEPTDPLRARAFLEATFLSAPLPRQRATAVGALTRMAVRATDLDAAEVFWGHLAGGAPDLESDSEWRVTTGVLKVALGDARSALAALGESPEQVALQDALEFQGTLFRAHALQALGKAAPAKAALQGILEAGGPAGRAAIERVRELYAPLDLCGGTLDAVLAERDKAAAAGVGAFSIGFGLLLVGILTVVDGSVLLVSVGAAVAEGLARRPDAGAIAGALCPFAITCPTTLPFLLWGVAMVWGGFKARRTFRRGVRAKARLLSATPTGTTLNDQPEMELELEVLLDPPLRSRLRTIVHVGQLHALTPGSTLYVRVDPSDPSTAVLDA